jgi:PEP-CTERM motif
MKTHPITLAFVMLVGLQQATAQTDPRYGAHVGLSNLADYAYDGQTSAGGSVTTGLAGAVLTEGAAGFGGFPSLHVNVTSVQGRGVIAKAYLFDQLTFHVAGGGSAVVPFHMEGNWTGQGFSTIKYTLILGQGGGGDTASPTGFLASRDNYGHAASSFIVGSGDYIHGAAGTYAFDALLTVTDGYVYGILASVEADASDGARAYVDDPLTVTLPSGVTFTSASGDTYMAGTVTAVPEPSAWLLMGSGLICMAWLRRTRRQAA